jgi:hypothetical protein
VPTTAFDPVLHGFGFPNRFLNQVARLPTGDAIRTSGRCGGMAYAALDAFHLGRRAPQRDWSGSQRGVPPDGTPIADYLLRRQLDSFENPSALRFLSWTVFPDEVGPFFGGVHKWTSREVREVCDEIDQGRPCVVGLIGASRLGDVGRRNHQAVACGYEKVPGGVRLEIYDSNTPRRAVSLEWRRGGGPIAASNRAQPWRGLFRHTYSPTVPPTAFWT